MARVVVGLSGGVDSSVAAMLLLREGHEVIGMFMKNWHDETVVINNECPWEEDSRDALMVAEKLGIPFQTLDLSKEYKERIVDYMFREYEAGRTPNPDVLCNREIKFDVFLKAAEKLGADYVATGHYCRREVTQTPDGPVYHLLAGADPNKDQSYFLCQITQEQLSRALFPIGHLQKSEVRALAAEAGLITAGKRDSQGLCFVGKVRLPDFLQQQLKPKKGSIIEIPSGFVPEGHAEVDRARQTMETRIKDGLSVADAELFRDLDILSEPIRYHAVDGKVVGEHNGAHYFTIGQRKGLQVGGKAEPLFVLETNTTENVIYTGMGDHHPGLYRSALTMERSSVNLIDPTIVPETGTIYPVMARIRYRQPLQEALLIPAENTIYLYFRKPQRGITPGQFAAWYKGEELLGSGVISA